MKRAGRVEWGKAARSRKKRSRPAPLELKKVTINEFPSNSKPTYAIHSRNDYNKQTADSLPYFRDEWYIRRAPVKNASKAGARALNYSIKQEKGGKQGWRPGERTESSALRTLPLFSIGKSVPSSKLPLPIPILKLYPISVRSKRNSGLAVRRLILQVRFIHALFLDIGAQCLWPPLFINSFSSGWLCTHRLVY